MTIRWGTISLLFLKGFASTANLEKESGAASAHARDESKSIHDGVYTMEGYVPKALALVAEVRRLNRQANTVHAHHVRDAGLDRRGWELLTAVDDSAYCLSISDLARVLRQSRQRVHRLAARLARKGYLEMRPNHDDRRLLQLFLTSSGKSLIAHARRQFSDVLRACILDADTRELLAAERVLRKLRLRFEEHEQHLKTRSKPVRKTTAAPKTRAA